MDPRGYQAVRKYAPRGKRVLPIDAFQTGSVVAPRDRSHEHFLSFNQTEDANRVQDILTAAAYLKQQGAGEVTLEGSGDAAIWCLFAAAVSPAALRLATPAPANFAGDDQDFLDRFFVPGIQRAGGLQAALWLTAATGSWPPSRTDSAPRAELRRVKER